VNIISVTINTLFPKHCVGCGRVDYDLCPECQAKIVFIKKQQCIRCLKIAHQGRTCTNCRKYSSVSQLLSAVFYDDGPAKELLHQYKFDGRLSIANVIVDTMCQSSSINSVLTSLDPSQSAITYVPLHISRKWRRGFNQAEILARKISYQYSLPKLSLIKRIKRDTPQHKLHRKERWESAQQLFATTNRYCPATVVIIDDVATTGATLCACALVLKRMGAKKIIAITYARAL